MFAKKLVDEGDRLNATFELVPGFSDRTGVSFRLVNRPGHYFVPGDPARFHIYPLKGADARKRGCTFKQVKGLDSSSGVSFESIANPGHFIHARGNGELWLDKFSPTAAFRSEATFVILEPQFKLW